MSGGEQGNKAELARVVSEQLFPVFGWTEHGPRDQNWDCVNSEEHNNRSHHPADAVLAYEDPYLGKQVFLNVDFKSWAKSTITKHNIAAAIGDLAQAVDCANVSPGWSKFYCPEPIRRTVAGLLFIYNHDQQLSNDDFNEILKRVPLEKVKLLPDHRVFILGPSRIQYLHAISNDLIKKFGSEDLQSKRSFHYPDLITVKPGNKEHRSATIEAMLGSWMVVKNLTSKESEYTCYFDGLGDSLDDFKYLFDFFFRYQLVENAGRIEIAMPYAVQAAQVNFQNAKASYASDFYSLDAFKNRLEVFHFRRLPTLSANLSDLDNGMKYKGK